MAMQKDTTGAGKAAARALRRETAEEEREVEKAKGSDLRKGADRFDERARAAGGGAAGSQKS